MLLWESTPAKWKTKIQIQYQLQKIRLKKEKPRLLTEQEFIDQSQLETTRALQDLREYCKSPKCDAWKMTSRLTSPSRFAEFVAGTTKKNIGTIEFSSTFPSALIYSFMKRRREEIKKFCTFVAKQIP